MTGRYPQDSNIIDFVEVKMLQLYEQYSVLGDDTRAEACWYALAAYVSGTIDIIFKRGQPYVIDREKNDTDISADDDMA